MPVFHTKTIEGILEPVAFQVSFYFKIIKINSDSVVSWIR